MITALFYFAAVAVAAAFLAFLADWLAPSTYDDEGDDQ